MDSIDLRIDALRHLLVASRTDNEAVARRLLIEANRISKVADLMAQACADPARASHDA